MRSVQLILLGVAAVSAKRQSLVWSAEQEAAAGLKHNVVSPLPSTYVKVEDLPTDFTWGDVNGVNYLTKNLNQHIPQYCGSCWAHGALSALGDRIKIARKAQGIDVNLAVQHVLNCGNAGSCHGGSSGLTYQWIAGNKDGVVYDTCNPYIACSAESSEGMCPHVNTTCTADNICRTCSTFTKSGGFCAAISRFPNATIAEHGSVSGADNMMQEIYARGPIACGVYAVPLHDYHSGVISATCGGVDHIVSVVGWGVDAGAPYWIVRNSWGEYWGEMGYFRVSRGGGKDLCLETSGCNWATPKAWTETNYPCNEDGGNCKVTTDTKMYVDPSVSGVALGRKL
eukprot:TRINITY_DN28_c0_g1_i3.p1 TRINITY_DN28_c0_g1~~TRINITY_DN28_c0_g1_i3.p1  ORF type:complete len:340 (+),score=125.71 TRINITY_DN28_c0_g1_i3:54-1073(+)